jgi:hypothetical protein
VKLKLAIVAFFTALGWKLWPFVVKVFKQFPWMAVLMFAIVLWYLFAIAMLTGCNGPELMKPDTLYRKDMTLTVNGRPYVGVGVVPNAKSYDISLESQEDVNLMTLNSCHRDLQFSDVITSGWFKPRRGYRFTFAPNKIESEPGCQLRIGGYNKEKGQHSWGLLVFENPLHKLDAILTCNGDADIRRDGDSICQTLKGLLQQITFEKPVKIAASKIPTRCTIDESKDGLTWRFKMQRDECTYVFQDIETKELHALKTFGYDENPVR